MLNSGTYSKVLLMVFLTNVWIFVAFVQTSPSVVLALRLVLKLMSKVKQVLCSDTAQERRSRDPST